MGISHESIPRQLSVGMQKNTTTHELGKHDIYLFNACNAFSRTSDFSNTGDSLSHLDHLEDVGSLQAADEENRKIIKVPEGVVVGLWKSMFMGI